jgi:hypothetical protein
MRLLIGLSMLVLMGCNGGGDSGQASAAPSLTVTPGLTPTPTPGPTATPTPGPTPIPNCSSDATCTLYCNQPIWNSAQRNVCLSRRADGVLLDWNFSDSILTCNDIMECWHDCGVDFDCNALIAGGSPQSAIDQCIVDRNACRATPYPYPY